MFLGEVIKQYRSQNGISQKEFADRSQLSKPYISQLENNCNPKTGEPMVPSAETFLKVSKAMHISLQELLEMVDENTPASLSKISSELNLPIAAISSEEEAIRIQEDGGLNALKGILKMPYSKNKDQTSGQNEGYYFDDEAAELAQEIYEDPELRVLLKAKRDLSKDDMEVIVNMIKALQAKDGK